MEGLNTKTNEVSNEEKVIFPNTAETRDQKIERAELNIKEMFDEKLEKIINRIAENPYFRDLEGSF